MQHAYLYSPKMVTNGYKSITRLTLLLLRFPGVSVQRDRQASAAKKATASAKKSAAAKKAAATKKAAAAKKAGGIIVICVLYMLPR